MSRFRLLDRGLVMWPESIISTDLGLIIDSVDWFNNVYDCFFFNDALKKKQSTTVSLEANVFLLTLT